MRHQSDDVTSRAADARDVIDAAVRVPSVGNLSVRIAIPEDHPARRLEINDHIRLGEIIAFAVRDRNPKHLPFCGERRECRVGLFDSNTYVLAAKLQVTVPQHRAWKQS